MRAQFDKEQANVARPQLEEFATKVRGLVVSFDTLGQDRGLSERDRAYLRGFVNRLK